MVKKDKSNKVKKIKASLKQRVAAKSNIAHKGVPSRKGTKVPSSSGMKAQAKWKSMTKAEHAAAQPEGRMRKKPGMGGKGRFYRVVVRDKNDFVMFRNHDIGKKGHVERVAGKRANGRWATVSWLIDKNEARISKGILVGKTKDVKDVLAKLRKKPKHLKGDIFEAGPRINVAEKSKLTAAMKKAQIKNIKKAQASRRES